MEAAAATAEAGGTATATAGGSATGSAAMRRATLEPPTGGGEEQRTRGRKALLPLVFAILKPEKDEKGVGEGGGGGGGGYLKGQG